MKSSMLIALALVALSTPVSAKQVPVSQDSQTRVSTAAGDTAAGLAVRDFTAQNRVRPISTRLEVYPTSRRVRRCVDWYAIERRPSGKVVTPQMRCWWASR